MNQLESCMKELNLLLLAPHWRVSLVRAFQAAKARLGFSGKLVGADSDPLAASLKVVDKEHTLPPFDDPACKNQLIDICRQEAIHAILPMTNKAIEFLNDHRKDLDKNNLLAYLQDAETIEICHDKQNLARFFESESIPSPKTGSAKIFAKIDHFPLIAKPKRGEGGKENFMIETQRDLEFYAQKYPGHVLQTFIHGEEYTVDWFSDKSGKPLLIVPRQRLQIRGGEVMVSKISLDPGIIELVRQVGLRLKLRGPTNLQGILTEDGQFFFTDINLRFGSGAGHTIAAGGDMPGYIYRDLAGEGDLTEAPSVQNGSVMTRFHDAFFSPELDS
jgi:carbamoyl-phosphate synthase large subunit